MLAAANGPAADPAVAALIQMFGQGDAPAVEIKYAPGVCDTDHAQLFDPDVRDVARAICRHMGVGPGDWVAVSAGLGQFERARTGGSGCAACQNCKRKAAPPGRDVAFVRDSHITGQDKCAYPAHCGFVPTHERLFLCESRTLNQTRGTRYSPSFGKGA